MNTWRKSVLKKKRKLIVQPQSEASSSVRKMLWLYWVGVVATLKWWAILTHKELWLIRNYQRNWRNVTEIIWRFYERKQRNFKLSWNKEGDSSYCFFEGRYKVGILKNKIMYKKSGVQRFMFLTRSYLKMLKLTNLILNVWFKLGSVWS